MALFYRRRNYTTAAELIDLLRAFLTAAGPGPAWVESFYTQGRASGWLTVDANPAPAETLTLGGNVWTFGVDIVIGATPADTAANIAAKIAADPNFNNPGSVLHVPGTISVYVHYNTPGSAGNVAWATTSANLTLSGVGFLAGGADAPSTTDLWLQTAGNAYGVYFRAQAGQVMAVPTWSNGQAEDAPILPTVGGDDAWNAGTLPIYAPLPPGGEETASGVIGDTEGIALITMFADDDLCILAVIAEARAYLAYVGDYAGYVGPADQLPVVGLTNSGGGAFPSNMAKIISGVQGPNMEGSLWQPQRLKEFLDLMRVVKVQPPISAVIPLSHKTNPAEAYLFPLWLSLDYPGMQEAFGLSGLLRASDGLPISMVADGNDAQQHVAANIVTVGGDDYYIFDQGNDTGQPSKLELPLATLTAQLTLETNKRVGIGPLGTEVV